ASSELYGLSQMDQVIIYRVTFVFPFLQNSSPSAASRANRLPSGVNSSLIHIWSNGVQLIQNLPFRSTKPRLCAVNMASGHGSSRWMKSQSDDSADILACFQDSTVSIQSRL